MALPPLPTAPPRALLEPLPGSGGAISAAFRPEAAAPGPIAPPCFFWEAPDGEAVSMRGVAARYECRGPRPWDEARAWLRTFGEFAASESGERGAPPRAFAGFSFDGSPAAEWGLPAGVVLIPAQQWHRAADGRGTVTSWKVSTGTDGSDFVVEGQRDGLDQEFAAALAGSDWSRADWSRADWSRAVDRALERIERGQIEKIVLARSRTASVPSPLDLAATFAALREAHPECFRFLYWSEHGGLFLGASPERLVSLREGRIEADAVAGTHPVGAPAGGTAVPSLLTDPKERREHEIVVREILAALEDAGAGGAVALEPSLQRLRHVVHLKSSITASAPAGAHVLDLVAHLHPTPAVAGSPRERAIDLIQTLEPRSRGWYAGPVGWLDAAGDGDFAVGIRSALVQGDRALLYAGAGIVEGSRAEREWEECDSKLRFMEDALLRG